MPGNSVVGDGPSGSYVFIPQTGIRSSDPAIRRLNTRNIQSHVAKRRRIPGLVRPRKPVQYPLEFFDSYLSNDGSLPSTSTELKPSAHVGADSFAAKGSHQSTSRQFVHHDVTPDASEPTWVTFDRLGAGLLDPFICYPFSLDSHARELMCTVLGANSGPIMPFRVVAFRRIWVDVSVIDVASFHQYLAGAQAYFDFLRTAQTGTRSIHVVAHHTSAIRLVNSKLSNMKTASSDGVIASLVLLARYYQMIGEFDKWTMHMCGIKEVISLRGHVDAIGMHELLRHMLSNIDISGSFAVDAVPIFPIKQSNSTNSRPVVPLTTLHPSIVYFITLWKSMLPECGILFDIISDACIENQLLHTEIVRTKGMLWCETMYVCHNINPLLHQLLCLSNMPQDSIMSLVANALRLSAAIYLATIRYAFGITPFQPGQAVQEIRVILHQLNDDMLQQSDNALLQEIGWDWLKIWILGCAALNQTPSSGDKWCLAQLHAEMSRLGIRTYDDFDRRMERFLWSADVHGVLLRGMALER